MWIAGFPQMCGAALLSATLYLSAAVGVGVAQTPDVRVEAALQNITTLVRSGQVGYATFWDGNKYVQCRRMPDRDLHCEAAGTWMQPSLRHVLDAERQSRLAALNWVLDPSFGNYVRTFPADMSSNPIADAILLVLAEAYDARTVSLEVQTTWALDMPCPPRNGPSQNLAGIVNDAPAMRATAVQACSYAPDPLLELSPTSDSPEALFALYGARATGEIQRLRINIERSVFVVFDAGIGYVQCMPDPSTSSIYCEAQSAESWPALSAILTPERVSRLRTTGYADPGYSPNYWKSYPLDAVSDAALAGEILTILHDVYGYTGAAELGISTK